MPEIPLEDAFNGPDGRGGVTRRAAIGGVAASVALGAVHNIDNGAGEILNANNPTEILYRPTEFDTSYVPVQAVTVIFPGFNANCDLLTEQVGPLAAPLGDVMSVRYGSDLDPDTVARRLYESLKDIYGENIPPVVMWGHSMGGIIGTLALSILNDRRKVPIAAICLDSSPGGLDDVKGVSQQRAIKLLSFAARAGIGGGPLFRGAMETASSLFDGRGLEKSFNRGVDKAIPKNSEKENEVVERQAVILDNADRNLPDAVKILQDTPIAYFGAENPDNDKVVSVKAAVAGWGGRFGAPVRVVHQYGISHGGHGIDERSRGTYGVAFREFLADHTPVITIGQASDAKRSKDNVRRDKWQKFID